MVAVNNANLGMWCDKSPPEPIRGLRTFWAESLVVRQPSEANLRPLIQVLVSDTRVLDFRCACL